MAIAGTDFTYELDKEKGPHLRCGPFVVGQSDGIEGFVDRALMEVKDFRPIFAELFPLPPRSD